MLALEIEYLMGRVLAATRDDRRTVEWPPHPSRLFSALVAAYQECDLDKDARAALEWLEALPESPRIYAHPPEHKGYIRDTNEVFVPVNDVGQVPERRPRQGRWFPAFTPQDRHVWFIWSDASGYEMHRNALQRIAENVTYLGHSMSPVRVHVNDSSPEPTLIPDPAGDIMLRTTGKGRLQNLEETYNRRKLNTTIQPHFGRITKYRVVSAPQVQHPVSVFRHVFVFRCLQGTNYPPQSAARLVAIVRKAILDLYPNPIPEVISGHDTLGEPLRGPHLAITPLLDAGHNYADGHVMGFALWLPHDVSVEIIETLEDSLVEFHSITLGQLGKWEISRLTGDLAARASKGMRSETYIEANDTWASVTPAIFGRFPKKSQTGPGKDGGRVFAELCEMIGLPKPVEARVGPASALIGPPMASEFMPPEKFANCLRAHVWLRFDEPVQGPVLIGAGRFAGFGLCRPWFG